MPVVFPECGTKRKTERVLIDSLVAVQAFSKAATTRVTLYAEIIYRHVNDQPKEVLVYVQPALDLANKHAYICFPDGRLGKVQIRLEKRKDGILQLQETDNGVGKSGLTRGTGFGGQLVSLLVYNF